VPAGVVGAAVYVDDRGCVTVTVDGELVVAPLQATVLKAMQDNRTASDFLPMAKIVCIAHDLRCGFAAVDARTKTPRRTPTRNNRLAP
jgi:hypothetical protein